ncbi:MAG: GHKL domain-containing protein [Ruminococcus sp.]|nr:GHKL domain-containing protein [Ruminococcus sp.]
MLDILNTYFFAIFEPIIILIALNNILPRKYSANIHKLCIVINIAFYFISLFLLSGLSILIRTLSMLLILTTVSCLCFSVKFEIRLFFILVTFELNLIADSICGNAFSFFAKDNILDLLATNTEISFILSLCSKCLFAFFEFILVKFSKKFIFYNSRRQWIVLDFIMIIIYGIIIWFLGISPVLQTLIDSIQMSIVSVAFIFIFLLVVYFFREVCIFQQRETETYNTIITNKVLENEIKAIRANSDNIRKIKHDLNNHLLCIEHLSRKSKDYEVANYCKKIIDMEDLYTVRYINHDVINAILNYKVEEIKNKKIEYKLSIEDVSDITIDSIDITGVLANLLDNAIEASQNLNNENGYIFIKICNYKGYLLIVVKNKYNKSLKFSNNHLITSKSDYLNHGFGIDIVSNITKRYSGIFQQEQDENYFTSTVMLLNKIS